MMKMNDYREQIINFIRNKGPCLPIEISKHIGKDLLLTSAMIAELTQTKKLIISNLKIGQSKLYLLMEQKNLLQNFSSYLNEKDKRTYELLKNEKIIREKDVEPLIRVSLRNIKDFALPIGVNLNGVEEIFWRWYLIDLKEAEEIIKKMLNIDKENDLINSKKDENIDNNIKIKNEFKKVEIDNKINEKENIKEETEEFKEVIISKEESTKENVKKEKKDLQLDEFLQTKKENNQIKDNDEFLDEIRKYFDNKGIRIINYDIVLKKKDIEFELFIPSPIGDLRYFCKAKKKVNIDEGDLAAAFVSGQLKKLPVLFITKGKLRKKAQEKLQKDFLGLKFVVID
jgi:hypothetical protein